MKVIQPNSSRLILRELNVLPIVFAVLLIGLEAFLGALLLSLLYGFGVKSIHCQRAEPAIVNCSLKSSHLFGTITSEAIELKTIKQAILVTETFTNNEGEGHHKHHMSLQSAATAVNVDTGFGYTGSWRAKDFTEKLNAFLLSRQQNLKLSIDTRLDLEPYVAIALYSLGLYALIYFGLIVIQSSDFITIWKFDQTKQKAFYQHARLLDVVKKRVKKRDYPLAAIAAIEIHNAQDIEDSESTPSYSINLLLDHDQSHPKMVALQNYGTSNLSKQQQIAVKLGNFLHVLVLTEPVLTKQRKAV